MSTHKIHRGDLTILERPDAPKFYWMMEIPPSLFGGDRFYIDGFTDELPVGESFDRWANELYNKAWNAYNYECSE